MMVKFSEEFAKKSFSSERMKDAFLTASKWVATNVISDPRLNGVQVSYEKQNGSVPTVVVRLYAVLDEKELRERHCNICKEMHASFFIDDNTNCEWCKAKGYQKRLDSMISMKREFYKDILRHKTE